MEHSRSKLPAMLAVLFCIALLAGVGVLLWKTLPEKQKPEQAETIQTDGVFSNEPTTVEPERRSALRGRASPARPPSRRRRTSSHSRVRMIRMKQTRRRRTLRKPPPHSRRRRRFSIP